MDRYLFVYFAIPQQTFTRTLQKEGNQTDDRIFIAYVGREHLKNVPRPVRCS